MECRSRKAKKLFLTRADAERQVQNAKRSGVDLYAYKCSCGYWHLATVKAKAKPAAITNAEWKHIKNRVADLGRQIANEDIRAAKKKVAELAPVVAEDRERLRRMKDAAESLAGDLRAIQRMIDDHFKPRNTTERNELLKSLFVGSPPLEDRYLV